MDNSLRQPSLSKAPVAEAILDVRFGSSIDVQPAIFDTLLAKLKEKYPNQKKLSVQEAQIRFGGEDVTISGEQSTSHNGYILSDESQSRLIQIRQEGFAANILQDYRGYEDLKNMAKEVWDELAMTFPLPLTCERISLRFVNIFSLELPFEPAEYFKIFPRFPLADDLQLNPDTLLRYSISDALHGQVAIITHRIIAKEPKVATIILDIDAIRVVPSESSQIWGNFDFLRSLKNAIFFDSLTEKAIQRFQ